MGQALGVCPDVGRAGSAASSRTPARLYACNSLIQRLPQHLQDTAAALGEFIQQEHVMGGQRPLAREGNATDQVCPRTDLQ